MARRRRRTIKGKRFPEHIRKRAARRRRKTRLEKAGGECSYEQWADLCWTYGNRCVCCGLAKPLTRDHVQPVARGGCGDVSNIQPLCRSCNSKKGTKTVDYRPKNLGPA